MDSISVKDRQILRNLAKKQLEIARSERNKNLIKDWIDLTACRIDRPLVTIEMYFFAPEVNSKRLVCEGEQARKIEDGFYRNIFNAEFCGDDRPVSDYTPISFGVKRRPFGLDVERVNADHGIGHQFVHQVEDLKRDFHKLGESIYTNDSSTINERVEYYGDLFGDILPPKIIYTPVYFCTTQEIVKVMGMEAMFTAMMDYPDLFHQVMEMHTRDAVTHFKTLEAEGLLRSTVDGEYLVTGTWCYNDELPDGSDGRKIMLKDIWGFIDAQETVGVSPDMFGEFFFPYQKRISDLFGLFSYGCCEPVHPHWDYIKQHNNLRRVSVSAWCDEEYMGDQLRGRKIIFHSKPSSNYLSFGDLDEINFRRDIRKILTAAKGCTLEITQRDVYSINNNLNNVKRYVDIVREEAANIW